MGIPNGTARISVIGTHDATEIFDTSFWLAGVAPADEAAANVIAQMIASAWDDTMSGGANAVLDASAHYDKIKAYFYPTGGPTATLIGEHPVVNVAGGFAGGTLPIETCLVASLRTGFSGRSKRGRMYLPASSAPMSLHQFQTDRVHALALAHQAFFNAVNAGLESGFVAVVSPKLGSSAKVTEVIYDTKPDIQRRRGNRQIPLFRHVVAIT